MSDENRFFADKDFPINVVPDRTSIIDRVDGKCEIHEAIEIKYFYEGRATLLIGSEAVEAREGDVIIMNPYEFHATVDYSEGRARYHLIMIGLDFFPSLPELCDVRKLFFSDNFAFVNKISDNAPLRELVLLLVKEHTEKKEGYNLRMRGCALEIFSLLMRCGMRKLDNVERKSRVRYHAAIEPALRLIKNEYNSPLTLDRLAEECYVNKSYFCRIFKEAIGKTPMQYLADYRINRADVLLRNTDKNICEVISACGFGDDSYFYRYYKKYFGVTPNRRRGENKS